MKKLRDFRVEAWNKKRERERQRSLMVERAEAFLKINYLRRVLEFGRIYTVSYVGPVY